MKYKLMMALLGAFLLCLGAESVITQTPIPPTDADVLGDRPINVERLAHLGGLTQAVAAQGSMIYLGEGQSLVVLDGSDPSHPIRLAQIYLDGYPNDIVLTDEYAYIAVGRDIQVIDIKTPSAPAIVGTYTLPGVSWQGWVKALALAGHHVYAACDDMGLRILDIATPTAPTEVAVYEVNTANDVAIEGTRAYLAEAEQIRGTLHIVDIANPTTPTAVGTYAMENAARALVARGNYVYMGGYYLNLVAIDVSDPISPTCVYGYDPGETALDLALVDQGLIVATSVGLQVFSLANPAYPTYAGEFAIPSTSNLDVFATHQTVYFANDVTDLQIIDLAVLQNPQQVGTYRELNAPRHVARSGDYLYVGDEGAASLRVVDIADPLHPATLGGLVLTNDVAPILIQAPYAYAADAVIDITSPTSPTIVAQLPGTIESLKGDYAYCNRGSDLHVVDITTPSAPISVTTLPDTAGHVALAGDTLYVYRWYELHVIDITNPTHPISLAVHAMPGPGNDLIVSATHAYLLHNERLDILDMSDPTHPLKLGAYPTAYGSQTIAMLANLIYVTDNSEGVRIIDVSDPRNPLGVGAYTEAGASHLTLAKGTLFAAYERDGLHVLHYEGNAPTTVILDGPKKAVQGGASTVFTASIRPATVAPPLTYTWRSTAHAPITYKDGATTTLALKWHSAGPQILTMTAANAWGIVTATHRITLTPSISVATGTATQATFTTPHGLTTTLYVASRSITTPIRLAYLPGADVVPPAGLGFAGHSFDLRAYRNAVYLPGFTFERPITLTLHYHNADIAHLDDEGELALYRWNSTRHRWQPAACGPVRRDLAHNLLTVPLCQTGRFALLGRIRVLKTVAPQGMVAVDDTLTYTLVISNASDTPIRMYDPLDPGLHWLGFVRQPEGIVFDDTAHGITGTLTINEATTVTFKVRVMARQSRFVNRACVIPNGQSFTLNLCRWSYPVTTTLALPLTWHTEKVESRRRFDFQDRGLYVDAAGHSHLAYGGDALYYTYFDGTTWHKTVADASPGVGATASLALDSYGHPHIAYLDKARQILKYAFWTGSRWYIEVVDHLDTLSGPTSLAIDTQNDAHISYRADYDQTRYARRFDGQWYTRTITHLAGDSSLALDSHDYPHISVGDARGLKWCYSYVKHIYWTGHEWKTETVDENPNDISCVGYDTSLQLDQHDTPHVAYTDNAHNRLRYAAKEGDNWIYQDVETDIQAGTISLALDAEGEPHIGYGLAPDSDPLGVKYAHWEGDGWRIRTPARPEQPVTGVAVAVDANAVPHLGYLTGYDLQYTRGDTWTIQTLDQAGDVGQHVDLALDKTDGAHITYLDSVQGALKLAQQDNAIWARRILDLVGNTGGFSSLVLDTYGHPHLSYISAAPNPTAPTLVYAHWTGDTWLTQTVTTVGNVLAKVSLGLDKDQRPHILTVYEKELRYAYWNGATWHLETVDQSDYSGDIGALDLTLDVYDRPHVSYNSQNQGLYYGMRTRQGWHLQRIMSADAEAYATSIALDHSQAPHIAYTTISGLQYTYLDQGNWHRERVDTAQHLAPSLTFDSSGAPHISAISFDHYHYYGYYGDVHYYARPAQRGWIRQTVATVTEMRSPTNSIALALDTQDLPHIAYTGNNDVNYAVGRIPQGVIFTPLLYRDIR